MPSIYLGFLVLAVVSAAASGGGREIVPREQAVAWPVSSMTDHFGALLLAPLNIAWLLQAWTLLGTTAYVAGRPATLWATELPVLLYLVLATALGAVVAWLLEWVRRGPHGVRRRPQPPRRAVRVPGRAGPHPPPDRRPRPEPDRVGLRDRAQRLGPELGPVARRQRRAARTRPSGLVLLGALPARLAAGRAPREEHRLESGIYEPRPDALGDLRALVRVDRVGIWRSLPLRRGLVVLALMPGLIAFGGQLGWDRLTILPGLVASGAALLFGVNTWCLDGRGALWRESLPVAPALAFGSRVWVLTEVLLGAALVTVLLSTLRAGIPTVPELVALFFATLVVAAQVVSASMRWSVRRPFSVDMRSARATPAPPVVMVGYSTRLALGTTFVGLMFSGLGETDQWHLTALIGLLMVLVSGYRVARTASRWEDPATRARVVVTVAG